VFLILFYFKLTNTVAYLLDFLGTLSTPVDKHVLTENKIAHTEVMFTHHRLSLEYNQCLFRNSSVDLLSSSQSLLCFYFLMSVILVLSNNIRFCLNKDPMAFLYTFLLTLKRLEISSAELLSVNVDNPSCAIRSSII
jgi:hypothetical protein